MLTSFRIVELFAIANFFFSKAVEKSESLQIIRTFFPSNPYYFVGDFLNKV